jgi:GT2 family glycosyltransferase
VIEIVSATRLAESEFWKESALGRSVTRLADPRIAAHVAFENRRGLPHVYNARILAERVEKILVFVHDDVWIDDFFLADRLLEGLKTFDAIGVAGNRRRLPLQSGWFFIDDEFAPDEYANLSGSIAHGTNESSSINFYGTAPAECELLDGVFMAAKRSVLATRNVLFDVSFDFHFYDMDFCRTARANGLRLGTWPICITHKSMGTYGSAPWRAQREAYRRKWGP